MAVEPADIMAYTSIFELPTSPRTPVTPWTTQPTPAHQSSPLLGQPPPSMTMQPTPATTFSHGPPEHVFGQPTDLHLHWTNRQPAPTFPPQPPIQSQPVPIHPHQLTPPPTPTVPTLDPLCNQQPIAHGAYLYVPTSTSRTPCWTSTTSSTSCICRSSSTRSTSTYDIHTTGYRHNNATFTARDVDSCRQKNSA